MKRSGPVFTAMYLLLCTVCLLHYYADCGTDGRIIHVSLPSYFHTRKLASHNKVEGYVERTVVPFWY